MRWTLVVRFGLIATVIVLAACAGNTGTSGKGTKSSSSSNTSGTTGGGSGSDVADSTSDEQSSTQDSSSDESQITTAGNKSCVQIMDCYAACSETDQACGEQCWNQGSEAGQSQLDAYYGCQDNAAGAACKTQCADQQSDACGGCLWESCWQGELACMSGEQTGTASCQTSYECIYKCTQGDSACMGTCLAQATGAAQQAIYAMWLCEDKAFAGTCATQCKDDQSEACGSCMEQACSSQYNACT